jgi:DNA invertase Pin-like site-specific DNA recombinase
MPYFAYLRISTDSQDNQNQKLGILDYCNERFTYQSITVCRRHSQRKGFVEREKNRENFI